MDKLKSIVRDDPKLIIKVHLLCTAIISLVVFFIDETLSKSMLLSGLCFNFYLRLLNMNFSQVLKRFPTEDNPELISKFKTMATIFSGLRAAFIAALIVLLIVKIKIKLLGVLIAFLLYKIVLLGCGLLISKFSKG